MTDKVTLSEEKETLLITLHSKFIEIHRENGIFKDDKLVELHDKINYDWKKTLVSLGAKEGSKKETWAGYGIAVRAKMIDTLLVKYCNQFKNVCVVHLAAGLDTRYHRVSTVVADEVDLMWYDIDYPEVVELRHNLIGEDGEKNKHIGADILLFEQWVDKVLEGNKDRKFIFVSEGFSMYISEIEMKLVFEAIKTKFPGKKIYMLDLMNKIKVKGNSKNIKKGTGAVLKFACEDPLSICAWDKGYTIVDDVDATGMINEFASQAPKGYSKLLNVIRCMMCCCMNLYNRTTSIIGFEIGE